MFLITDEARDELDKKTSVHVNNGSIQAILESLLKNSNLGYSVVERQVSLYVEVTERKNDEKEMINEIEQQKRRSGNIIDHEDNHHRCQHR